MIFGGALKEGNIAYGPGKFRNVTRIVTNNLIYIANLVALNQWYTHVRPQFISEDFPEMLAQGLQTTLAIATDERIMRLKGLSDQCPDTHFCQQWDELEKCLRAPPASGAMDAKRDHWLSIIQKAISNCGSRDYIRVIQSMEASSARAGTAWLQCVVDEILQRARAVVPSFVSGSIGRDD